MTAHSLIKHWLYSVAALSFTLASCQSYPHSILPTPTQSPAILMENEVLYAARETGQIILQDDALRIGVGNLAKETYLDEQGYQMEGMRVGLWFFFKDHPENEVHVRAYEGQVLPIQGYTIRVVEINPDDRMVVLGVSPSP